VRGRAEKEKRRAEAVVGGTWTFAGGGEVYESIE